MVPSLRQNILANMPFFVSDLKGGGQRAIENKYVAMVFENPFLSAGVATLVVLGLIFMFVASLTTLELGKLGLFIYMLMIGILFLNNRYLLQVVGGRDDEGDFMHFTAPPAYLNGIDGKFEPANFKESERLMAVQFQAQPPLERPMAPIQPAIPVSTVDSFRNDAAGEAYPTDWLK